MDWLKRLKETSTRGEATETLPNLSQPQAQAAVPTEGRADAPLSFLAEIITATGRAVYVATDDREAERAPEGAALFTRGEIEAMKGIPREVAEKIIDLKEIFGNGAIVEASQ